MLYPKDSLVYGKRTPVVGVLKRGSQHTHLWKPPCLIIRSKPVPNAISQDARSLPQKSCMAGQFASGLPSTAGKMGSYVHICTYMYICMYVYIYIYPKLSGAKGLWSSSILWNNVHECAWKHPARLLANVRTCQLVQDYVHSFQDDSFCAMVLCLESNEYLGHTVFDFCYNDDSVNFPNPLLNDLLGYLVINTLLHFL